MPVRHRHGLATIVSAPRQQMHAEWPYSALGQRTTIRGVTAWITPNSVIPRRGRLFCRVCCALPLDDGSLGRQCPWCRAHLSIEYADVVARCVECGTLGEVGRTLFARDYWRVNVRVPRAVCERHLLQDREAWSPVVVRVKPKPA